MFKTVRRIKFQCYRVSRFQPTQRLWSFDPAHAGLKRFLKLFCCLILLISTKAVAQDPYFSQFYSAPTFLSPSLAGSTGGTRFVANYRNQWPGITKTYQTAALSTDLYFSSLQSGLGILLVSDKAGSASLNTNYLGLQYSYRVQLGDKWQFIPGLQFTLGQKSLDRSKLVFPDQVVTDTPSSGDIYLTSTNAQYMDLTTSLFLYSPQFWFGAVADHLLRPNYSFMGSDTNMPLKVVAFGGMNLYRSSASRMEEPRVASLCYRYENQNGFNQLDIGGYLYGKALDVGVWYRGIPVFKNNKVNNQFTDTDAVVLTLGVTFSYYHIGYSYDLQLSKLAGYGAGAHEISLILEMGELFGCGLKYLDCFKSRNTLRFNEDQPRNMKVQ
jgi:type IX secretion system PorP/SprF family membrane protein